MNSKRKSNENLQKTKNTKPIGIQERSISLLQSLSFEHIQKVERNRDRTLDNTTSTEQLTTSYAQIEELSLPLHTMGNRNSSRINEHPSYGYYEEYEDDIEYAGNKKSLSRREQALQEKLESGLRTKSPRNKKSFSRREQVLQDYKAPVPSSSTSDELDYDEKNDQFYTIDELVDQEIYVVRQSAGHFSIGFSVLQTVILGAMMIMCGIAPLQINPMVGPYPDALDFWGAKNAYKILNDDEWWRFFTPLLLHGGVIHLLCNISVQLDVGAFYEREWGSNTWLIIYISSGIGSSMFSCCFMPDNISVGSSGAVMGLFGGKLAEIFCRACESKKTKTGKIGHKVRMEQLSESLCSVILVLVFSFVPFVDWAAHLGGLIAGFTAGILCFSTWIKTPSYAIFWFVVGIIVNLAVYIPTLIYLYTSINPMNDLNDICGYYQQFFEDYECNCQV